MTTDQEFDLENRVAKVLREECQQIFKSTWNLDNAHRLARVAIDEMKRFKAELP